MAKSDDDIFVWSINEFKVFNDSSDSFNPRSFKPVQSLINIFGFVVLINELLIDVSSMLDFTFWQYSSIFENLERNSPTPRFPYGSFLNINLGISDKILFDKCEL